MRHPADAYVLPIAQQNSDRRVFYKCLTAGLFL
jgi:hypothetical protein